MGQNLYVVAIGGNSLIKDSKHKSIPDQYRNTDETSSYLADLIAAGMNVVVTHGNGPQVGFILMRSELSKGNIHEVPLDVCGADTQGAIGYHLQQTMGNQLLKRGIRRSICTVVTQVKVNREDPSFQTPTKPIGPFLTQEEALRCRDEKGWSVMEDAGRGWRRVVASPRPTEIVEIEVIRQLVSEGHIVVAVGGGGIPVIEEEDGTLLGVAAVIDKDLASALLANDLDADGLVISTGIDKVCLNFGKPDQMKLDELTVADARKYLAEGQFKPGSMKPKIEAAIEFLERGGKTVVICSPDSIAEAVRGDAGTRIVP